MNKTPFFSIIVPTYNQAHFLKEALDSILNQTDSDWEAIVVNDGSTDNTAQILKAYSEKDSRFRIINQENGGTAKALNVALEHAQGEWICWLSSDDFYKPNKLAVHRKWIKKNPATKAFFTYFQLLDETTGKLDRRHELWGPLPEEQFQIVGLFYRNYINGISICINRKAWEEIGYFDVSMGYAQDFDLWLRLFSTFPAKFIPVWTCVSRIQPEQGMSVFPQRGLYDTAKSIIEFINKHKFCEYFPLLDLRNPEQVVSALNESLRIVGEIDGFIYALGYHPAFIIRIMEWISELNQSMDRDTANMVINIFQQKVLEYSEKFQYTPLGFFCEAASKHDFHSPVSFTAIQVNEIAKIHYWIIDEYNHLINDYYWYKSEPLHRYLANFLDETVISIPKDIRVWIQNLYPLQTNSQVKLYEPNRKQIIFVERALNGGGAEKVIHSISHKFDKEKYDVRIIYFFDQEGSMPPYTIPVYALYSDEIFNKSYSSADSDRKIGIGRRMIKFLTDDLFSRSISENLRKVRFFVFSKNNIALLKRIFDKLISLIWKSLKFICVMIIPANLRSKISPQIRSRFIPQQYLYKSDGSDSDTNQFLTLLLDRYWKFSVRLNKVLENFGEDALIIPVMEEAAIVVWLSQLIKKRPYISSLHTVESIFFHRLYTDTKQLEVEWHLFKQSLLGAEKIVIPSQGCVDDVVENFLIPKEKIEALPNPVDLKQIRTLSTNPMPLTISDEKPLFVHVGRLHPDKNHKLLIQACSIMKNTCQDFQVICLGKGAYRPEIEDMIIEFGLEKHITLFGEVANPYPFMAKSRSLILTSKLESFALVLVEAMACGSVPISVDCPYGPKEIIGNDEFGLLVPMDNPQALADAMEKIMKDDALHSSLQQMGQKRCEDYDLNIIIPKWEKFLD